jgi:NhaP-type Na+/H+ or K+/H+ antiporter
LPPLIYASAVDLPWPEFRDNPRPIGVLAIGLVAATAAAAAAVLHFGVNLPWAVAIVMGAIVSPTDPVAASAVAAKTGLPRRLIAILEGEGLVNDAMALTIFKLSLTAAVAGSFSWPAGLLRFAAILVGEPLYGVSLLTPFAAYLVPEHLGGSGVLATVAAGMYIGERRSTMVPAGTRLQATSVWQTIVFLLNGLLFLAAGIESKAVVFSPGPKRSVLLWGAAVAVTVILLRAAWCSGSWQVLQRLRRVAGRDRQPMPFRHLLILAWSGIRGPILLTAAMAIPAYSGRGSFPAYPDALSVVAVVVITTLFLQGSTLSPLARRLRATEDAEEEQRRFIEEEELGQAEAVRAALERLSGLEAENEVPSVVAAKIREYYDLDLALWKQAHLNGDSHEDWSGVFTAMLDAERGRVLELRNQGRISDHAMGRLELTLDLRQRLLEGPDRGPSA